MTPPRPAAEWNRLAGPLLRMLGGDSSQALLAGAAELLATISGANASAAFLIDADQVIDEAWFQGGEVAPSRTGLQVKTLALQSVRAGGPVELPPADKGVRIRIVLLRSQAGIAGAAGLVFDRASNTDDHEAELELAAQVIAEALLWQRRRTAIRVSSDQQERWFRQLDQQVRVLDRERQKFAAVVNQSDTYAFVADTAGAIRWVNRTMTVQPAPGGVEWAGLTCRDMCSTFAKSAGACNCPVARALEGNGAVHHEFRGDFKGRSRTLYVSALPIKGVDGRPQEVLVMMQDLTDLEALKESEERYRVVTQAASDGIVTIDENSTIIFVNDALQKMFGYSYEELVGKPLMQLMPSTFIDRHKNAFRAYIDTGVRRMSWAGIQLPALHKSGREILVEMSFGEFGKEGKRLFTAVMRDITDRRRLEDQLRQSQKMEAVGRLAGGVAHDFNNLLTTILGYTTLLLQRHDMDDEPDRRLVEIKRAAERAAGLTRQLLAFSRRQVVEPQISDLNRIVAEIEDMLRRLIGEDIDLAFHPAPEPAWVRADTGQLEQVVMNLVVNARDAMPRGGRLTIEITHVDQKQPLTQGDVTLKPGFCVALTVRDTGCGMDAETLARVFEPFFTSKDFGQGTGLGLAIVYGIVQQSAGHITVSSEPDAGSSFTIYLPLAEAAPIAEAQPERANAMDGTETLLLVEDEGPVRKLASEMLLRHGYIVIEAANGPEALALAECHAASIDLLITDVIMPKMSGGELVERLQQTHPTLRVLYISGYNDDAIVRHGVSHANSAFLQKPFAYEAFVAKVRDVLDRPVVDRAAVESGTKTPRKAA
jgi:PAS domain S-box-containing protein